MMSDQPPKILTPLSTDAGRLARLKEVLADVSVRLRGVCASLSDDEFAALMRQIAEVTVKYEALAEARSVRIDTPPNPDRSGAPRAS